MTWKKIGELLKEAGLIDDYNIEMALKRQRTRGGLFGSNLVMTHAIDEQDLLSFLAQHTGVEEIDLDLVDIPPDLKLIVPEDLADRFNIVPLEVKAPKTLVVACADPTDLATLDELSFATNYHIQPRIATYSSIYQTMIRYYQGINVRPKSE